MTDHDDLRRGLDNIAETIEVGDLDLAAVRTRTHRRRRRVQLMAGLGAVTLLAGATVAVVAVTPDDEPDSLVIADVQEPDESSPSTSIGDEEPATTELSTAAAAQAVEVIERPGLPGQIAGVGGAPEYGEWSAAWRDGFLVGSQAFAPQPLPAELPEEVTALFPQEVRDLFGGDLPPTIEEAMQMLQEAGLLDVVTEIIAANPEASAAIYSTQSQEPPTLDVRFTTDGVVWEPIEAVMPPDASYISGATGVGDRLVVWYGTQGPNSNFGDGSVRVATTVDLVNWNVQEIVVPPPPFELPDGADWSVQPSSFAANDSGWVANVYANVELDPFELVPAEVRAELDVGTTGFSFGQDDTGIMIEAEGGDAIVYTWDELGVAPEVAEYLAGQNFAPTTWAARWDGVPAPSQTSGPMDSIVATPAGFVGLGSDVRYSADGLTWSIDPLPVDDAYYVTASFTFDGGIIAFVDTPDGIQFYRFDERGGSPQQLEIPGLPANAAGGWGSGNRLGVILDAAEPGPPPPPLVVEADGYRLTENYSTGVVEIVDVATGEIVVTSDMRRGAEEGPVTWDFAGVTVTDPTTGEVVVVFPREAIDAANEALYENDAFVEQEYNPDLWLL
ncbi:MAG TPA: hypothetical protein VMW33_03470, partial [Ilumatobacteraceae bacterium]|nr:hypothetical protein [Ilumatobacteraceae bacterium]